MKETIEVDVAIVGGGIAGLWLLNRLRQLGFSAILLESSSLGGEQTHKAQGIIHGGMKYSLQGVATPAAQAIANMPQAWLHSLEGRGEIDLQNVPILSKHQYLWTTGAITSKLAGFFASFALKGNVKEIKKENFPSVFQYDQFKGQVYALDEMVVDVNALIRELVKPNQDVIFKIDPIQESQIQFDETGKVSSFEVRALPMRPLQLHAKKFIFTAGGGNENLLRKITHKKISMQRRPLHMVIVKHELELPLYAHCLGLGTMPRITITTHRSHDDKTIWYLGGQIAEEGVNRSREEQIEFTKKELKELFPWLNFSNAQFTTFKVDRAEPLQAGGKRPDSCHMEVFGNNIIAWPTKLAFAPLLANQIIDFLEKENVKTGKSDIRELRAWPIPSFAKPIWDQLL